MPGAEDVRRRGWKTLTVDVSIWLSSLFAIGAGFLSVLLFALEVQGDGARGSAPLEAVVDQGFLLLAVASGVAAMATIELIKRLTPIRGLFHRRYLMAAIGRYPLGPELPFHESVADYDAPIEQVIARVSASADQQILNLELRGDTADPVRVPEALARLTGREMVRLGLPATPSPPRPSVIAGRRPSANRDVPTFNELGDEAELRARLETGLDSLQQSIGNRWRRNLRLSACILSSLYAFLMLVGSGMTLPSAIIFAPISFLVGGTTSWVTRDIVAGIEKWRQ